MIHEFERPTDPAALLISSSTAAGCLDLVALADSAFSPVGPSLRS